MHRLSVLVLAIVFCVSCQNAAHSSWQVLGEYNEHHSIMTAGFHDETFAITGGVSGYMAYSTDSGVTWDTGENQSDCRYGMEVVSHAVAWTCGGMNHVRRSIDGGKTWQASAAFGDRNLTNPCHSMSFLDEKTGWLAASTLFGTTNDGGATWNLPAIPPEAVDIATIDTYQPGAGYLLDEAGHLYVTQDNAAHWTLVAQLPVIGLKIPVSPYQWAAMRFTDAGQGVVVWSSEKAGQVLAFRTADAGKTWATEVVPVTPGPVYLARDGRWLTVITGANIITLLHYGNK